MNRPTKYVCRDFFRFQTLIQTTFILQLNSFGDSFSDQQKFVVLSAQFTSSFPAKISAEYAKGLHFLSGTKQIEQFY